MAERFVLYNKQFYRQDEAFLTPQMLVARLFDVEMKLANTKLLFWEEYQEIILSHLRLFQVPVDEPYRLMSDVKRQIQRSYVKNKLYKGVVVHLTFFMTSSLTYLIELKQASPEPFAPSNELIELMMNSKLYKSHSLLSSFPVGNSALWALAKQPHLEEKHCQIPLIVDHQQHLLEVPRANLFLITKDKIAQTPHISLGICVNPARRLVIDLLLQQGYEVEESKELSVADLLRASELFLANDLQGIRSVAAFKQVRYYRTEGKQLAQAFIEALDL